MPASTSVPPQKNEVISTLRALQSELNGRGIRSAALFGSILHGEAKADSDIDILIDTAPGVKFSLIDLVAAQQFLEDKFSRPIDLVMREGLIPSLKDSVFAEAECAF